MECTKDIVLCGFMGSGKTTVGRNLAAALNYEFADMDSIIEEKEGRSISEIFEKEGEGYFRQMENVTAGLLAEKLPEKGKRGIVISTGVEVPLVMADFLSFCQYNLITTKDAAACLGCSKQNVDDLVRRGKLHPIRYDTRYNLFVKSEVEQRTW